MAGMKVKTKFDGQRLAAKTRKASIGNLRQAGAYIRGIARRSIKVSPQCAPPGKPPRSRKGCLKNAIVFSVEKGRQSVVIGPTATAVGQIGRTHEKGGTEPPKAKKSRRANWKLEAGGHGPVRFDGTDVGFAKLKTDAQVERAKKIAPTIQANEGQRHGPAQSSKVCAAPVHGASVGHRQGTPAQIVGRVCEIEELHG